jgi:hypothetical protein
MKPTITMFVCVLAAGLAVAQNPSIIQNTRNTMDAVRDNSAAASNAALGNQETSAPAPAPAKASGNGAAHPAGAGRKRAPRSGSATIVRKAVPVQAATEEKTSAPIPGTVASSTPPGSENPNTEDPSASDKKYNPNGKRDPFVSPVVTRTGGSGCSAGKKCLEIGQINLRGIVRSETGFIAVVSNGLNKAYFLRENDPVFNGYVVKITDDSIVFQETLQDHLGKTFTREVVKKITTPAV